MFALFLAPLYMLACAYIFIRLINALGYCSEFFKKKAVSIPLAVVLGLFAFSPIIGFSMPTGTEIRRTLISIGNYWFGIILYTLLIVAISQLISVLLRRVFKVIPRDFFRNKAKSLICLLLTVVMIGSVSVYGIVNARIIKVKDYSVTIDKEVNGLDELKIVLIADLHIGYNIGVDHIRNMVDKVNEQNPDLVCIAGDIYDNDLDAFEDFEKITSLLGNIKSKYGTYACWGNHDVNQKILAGFTFDTELELEHDKRMIEMLKEANINILADESVLIDNKFYLVGRVDGEKPATKNDIRKTPKELVEGFDMSKPIIVMHHEPAELAEEANAGVDLLLCGHTHDGQLFPGNIITGIIWENSCGYLKKGNMHNIVTSGVGIWGPFMRVGTDSEICNINVKFE